MLRGEKASICILSHQAHAEVDAIDGMATHGLVHLG
jgi:hypothetical protein